MYNMKTVKITKAILRDKLNENLRKHQDMYQRAIQRYRENRIQDLELELEQLKKYFTPPTPQLEIPELQISSYDVILHMLDHISDTEIELDTDQYSHWVLDNWPWKARFVEVCNHYTQG